MGDSILASGYLQKIKISRSLQNCKQSGRVHSETCVFLYRKNVELLRQIPDGSYLLNLAHLFVKQAKSKGFSVGLGCQKLALYTVMCTEFTPKKMQYDRYYRRIAEKGVIKRLLLLKC